MPSRAQGRGSAAHMPEGSKIRLTPTVERCYRFSVWWSDATTKLAGVLRSGSTQGETMVVTGSSRARFTCLAGIPCLLLVIADPGVAQVVSGTISGIVVDSSDAAVQGASVTLVNEGTQAA